MRKPDATNYAEAYEKFRWELPETFNYARDVVDAIAAATPDKLALIWCDDSERERRFTFADISRLTSRFANVLAANGVGRGDRILIMLPRIPEWQIAVVGCLKAGAIPVPCIDMLTEKDVTYRIAQSGAVAAVTTTAAAPKVSNHHALRVRLAVGGAEGWTDFDTAMAAAADDFTAADIGVEEPAIIYYTSGSTGLPKGVTHASRALFSWRVSSWYWHETTPNDVIWCTADTGWSKAGTSILFGPWSTATGVFFYNGRFDPKMRLSLIKRYGVTVFCAATTEFRHLINEDLKGAGLSSLRLAISAGEAVNPEVARSWQDQTGVKLIEAYGQTETLMTVSNYAREPVRGGSMGRPLPGTQMATLDDDGVPQSPGVSGQLALRLPNPQLMLGYWNDPERTAGTRSTHDGVDYFLTGDMATIDTDGYITYDGRTDDIISSAGYRIGPLEVENALIEHPAVLESAAVGSPDKERGEIVKAFIVLADGFTPSDDLIVELQAHVRASTAPYKYPRAIAFVPSLPKTVTGKILRRELKADELKRA